MLISLSDLLRDGRSMSVKKSEITGPFSEDTRGRRKMLKYWSQIGEAGILDGFKATGTFLEQVYSTYTRHFLETQRRSSPSGSAFVSLTSSSRSVNSALCFHDAPADTIPFSTLSGMCLFGSGTDWLLTDGGHKISAVALGESQDAVTEIIPQGEMVIDVGACSPYSYYELEKTVRLSQWIRWLHRNPRHLSHHLVTPRLQYYLYLAPAYDLGRISSDAFLQWTRLVSERERRIQQLFSEACGFAVDLVSSPLATIEDYIVGQLESGSSLDLDHVLEILNRSDAEWPELLAINRPGTWKALVNLSYVVAFSTEAKSAANDVRHLVHVDDPLEYVILSETARLNRAKRSLELPTFPLLGIYLSQKIGHQDPNCESSLYEYTPCEEDLELLDRVYGCQGDGLDISKWAAGVHVEALDGRKSAAVLVCS